MSSGEPSDSPGEGNLNARYLDIMNKMRELNSNAIEQHRCQKQAIEELCGAYNKLSELEEAKREVELAGIKREREETLKAIQRDKDKELTAEREESERWRKQAIESRAGLTAAREESERWRKQAIEFQAELKAAKEEIERWRKQAIESQAELKAAEEQSERCKADLTRMKSVLVELVQTEVQVVSSTQNIPSGAGGSSNPRTLQQDPFTVPIIRAPQLNHSDGVLEQEERSRTTKDVVTVAFSTPPRSQNLPMPLTPQPTRVADDRVSSKAELPVLAPTSFELTNDQPKQPPPQLSSAASQDTFQEKDIPTGNSSSQDEDAPMISRQRQPLMDTLYISNPESTRQGCSEAANAYSDSDLTSLTSSESAESDADTSSSSDEESHPLLPQKRQHDAALTNDTPASKKAKLMPVKKELQSVENAPNAVFSKYIQVRRLGVADGSDKPATRELQSTRCSANRYKSESENYSKCISCTRRRAGDTCRFQNIRYFVRNNEGTTIDIAFTKTARNDEMKIELPIRWNYYIMREHTRRTKIAIAPVLLPILEAELKHVVLKGNIHRSREGDARTTCDTCLTSLFSGTWLCHFCGREACAECFAIIKELTNIPDATDKQQITAWKDEMQTPQCNAFLNCFSRNGHSAKEFMPMSRLTKEQIQHVIEDMMEFLEGDEFESDKIESDDSAVSESAMILNPTKPLPHPRNYADMGRIPSHPIGVFRSAEIDKSDCKSDCKSDFLSMWNTGKPLVVTELLSKFKLTWTPEYFIKHSGEHSCTLVECQTEKDRKCLVEEFFKHFGKYAERQGCWDLREWSATLDFKSAFPALYDDLNSAVPLPEYVRPDGVLNIASHFPLNIIPPKLGPVINTTMASSTAAGSKGSIRLRMNMADTVSIMTFSSLKPDGTEGCAAWDIFRSEDSDKIRSFLRSKASQSASSPSESRGSQPISSNPINHSSASSTTVSGSIIKPASVTVTKQDPIHSEQNYLDDELRHELWDTMGVKSYRFYQTVGEAVLVPAGCAYQVCNLSDCINVAVGFVSPDSISRCQQVTREVREHTKMDTLQLRTAMWFAWLNCIEEEKRMGGRLGRVAEKRYPPRVFRRRFLEITQSASGYQVRYDSPVPSPWEVAIKAGSS